MPKESKRHIIESYIIDKINSGELKENDKIPTEEEICELFDVSRMTAHNAISDLTSQGFLIRIRGRGTFVNRKPLLKYLNHKKSFTEDMKTVGMVAGAKILEFHQAKAAYFPKAMKELKLDKDVMVYHFVRLRTGDDEPIAIQSTYIPTYIVPDFEISALEGSLDKYMETKNITKGQYETKLNAVKADDNYAKILGIKKGDPLLQSRTYRFTKEEIAYEYTETYYRADRYEYSYSFYIQ